MIIGMGEWNKVDLHIHSQHGITYDGNKKEDWENHFSLLNLVKRNIFNNLALISITNHNIIDVFEMVKSAYVSKKYSNCNLLPGVELDVIINNCRYHIILVFSERVNIIELSCKISCMISNKEDGKRYLYLHELVSIIENTECIIIPHACKIQGFKHNQEANIPQDIADNLIDIICSGSQISLLFEHTKPYFNGSFSKNIIQQTSYQWINEDEYLNYKKEVEERSSTPYVGSDYRFTKDITGKDNRDFPAIWCEATYRGLQLICLFPQNRLKPYSKVIVKSNYISKLKIEGNKFFETSDIKLSSGLNSIVGKSASGKTALLHIIYSRLYDGIIRKGKSYEFTNDLKVYFFDKDDKPIHKKEIQINAAESLYDEIAKVHQSQTTEVLSLFGYELNEESIVLNDYESNLKIFVLHSKNYYKSHLLLKENASLFNENMKNLLLNIPKNNDKIHYSISVGNANKINNKILDLQKLQLEIKNIISNLKAIDYSFNNIKYVLKNYKIDNNLEKISELYKKEIDKVSKKIDDMTNFLNYKSLLYNKINNIISFFNKSVGQKTEYLERVINNIIRSKDNINNALKLYFVSQYQRELINLEFPKADLIEELKNNNKNEYIDLEVIIPEEIFNFNKGKGLFDSTGLLTPLNHWRDKSISTNDEISTFLYEIICLEKEVKFRKEDVLKNILQLSKLMIGYPGLPKQYLHDISPGDASKIYIDYKFKHSFKNGKYNVVLFDQPENDVDKDFIYTELIRQINDLKQEVQVILTSHDPLIVVNGDSNYFNAYL
jgi:DNA-binding transcriptional MerR regulator